MQSGEGAGPSTRVTVLLVDKIHKLTGKEDVLGSKISPEMVGNMVKDRAQGSKMHALLLGFF